MHTVLLHLKLASVEGQSVAKSIDKCIQVASSQLNKLVMHYNVQLCNRMCMAFGEGGYCAAGVDNCLPIIIMTAKWHRYGIHDCAMVHE